MGSVFAIKPSNRFLSHESFYFPAPCIGTFGKEKKFIVTFIVPGHTISWPNGETSSPLSLAAERWWAEEKGGTRWERRWNERKLITLQETSSSHLKMDGWNTSFLFGWPIFRGLGLFQGVHLFLFLNHFAMLILSLALHNKLMEGLVGWSSQVGQVLVTWDVEPAPRMFWSHGCRSWSAIKSSVTA